MKKKEQSTSYNPDLIHVPTLMDYIDKEVKMLEEDIKIMNKAIRSKSNSPTSDTIDCVLLKANCEAKALAYRQLTRFVNKIKLPLSRFPRLTPKTP